MILPPYNNTLLFPLRSCSGQRPVYCPSSSPPRVSLRAQRIGSFPRGRWRHERPYQSAPWDPPRPGRSPRSSWTCATGRGGPRGGRLPGRRAEEIGYKIQASGPLTDLGRSRGVTYPVGRAFGAWNPGDCQPRLLLDVKPVNNILGHDVGNALDRCHGVTSGFPGSNGRDLNAAGFAWKK